VIDLETVQSTEEGTRLDRLSALLIGLIALLAALLAVAQAGYSQAEARASAMAARLSTDISAHLNATNSFNGFVFGSTMQAVTLQMEGTSRQFVGLTNGDELQIAVGAADRQAGEQLIGIAGEMGAVPQPGGPVDPYAQELLAQDLSDVNVTLAEQNRQADIAVDAGARSGRAILGLSIVALAGVLVGLAAVLGEGRAGRLMLLTAWLAAGAGVVALTAAVLLPAVVAS
jgi:hypothetical protein